MSALTTNLFGSVGEQFADLGILSPGRKIGPYSSGFTLPDGVSQFSPLIAQVTVKEDPIDELEITRHPVEYGASMTDHSFKLQAQLVLEVGWSNSGFQALANDVLAGASLLTGGGGTFNYAKKVYNQLLAIQLSRVPINITTGKRKYQNMLIKRMKAPTTSETENSIFVTMMLEEAIVAVTVATTFPDPSVQANPQSTGGVQNTGSVQPQITAFVLNPDGSIGQQVGIHQ
jgi:hypothetical protein